MFSQSSVTLESYAAFVRSIYSTYAAADEKERRQIRMSIWGKLGDFYYPSNPVAEQKMNNTVFVPELDENKFIIRHCTIEHGHAAGTLEFSKDKAIIKTIVSSEPTTKRHTIITIDNNGIIVETFDVDDKGNEINKTVKVGEVAVRQLNNFFFNCNLHTIPELAKPFLNSSAQPASVGNQEESKLTSIAIPAEDEQLYPSQLSPVHRSTDAEVKARLGATELLPQYEPYQSPYPQYQPYQPPVAPQYQAPSYTSKRYDDNESKQDFSLADFQEIEMYMFRKDVEQNPYFNTGKRKGKDYKTYADIDCLDLSEARNKPGLFSRIWNTYTKVEIPQGELGLIIHNGQKEIIAPGTYYFSQSTTLDTSKGKDGKVKASDPLIEHGNIKIVTVPRGHLEHAFVQDEKGKSKHGLMGPGRYCFDNNADKVSSVINPYGLETSLKNDKTVFKVIVPDGKAGFGKIKESEGLGSDVQTYPSGKTIVNTEIETFEGRVSTKVQSVPLKKIQITLNDGITATVDATVSYQIPDDTKAFKEQSSIQKVVIACGRTEGVIKNKIECEGGLAQQAVEAACANMNYHKLLQDNKIVINAPETDLNTPENTEYQGVKFLSVSFNNIVFDKQHADRIAANAIGNIESSLEELDDKNSVAYQTMRADILYELELTSKPESKEQSESLTATSSVPKLDIANLDGEETRNKMQSDTVPSEGHTSSPAESAEYFERKEIIKKAVAEDGNYQFHTPIAVGVTPILVPCISESYFNSFKGWFSWFRNLGKKPIEIAQDEIGLIRINGTPEFLKPGTYYLPSSIEWVRKEKIKSQTGEIIVFQHDSITVANIPAGNRLYVEDNTLYSDGSVKDYSLLGEGIHVIDSPTMTYRELIPSQDALMVKRSDDEKSRIKATELEFSLEASPPVPGKNIVYLREKMGCIAYTLQDPKTGQRVDGVLKKELQDPNSGQRVEVPIKAPLEWGEEAIRKLEVEIRQALALEQKIEYIPEQDKNNKVLAVKIGPTEAGIFYNEKGKICICGPGELQLQDGETYYSKVKLEGKKEITVEAYTADNIRVKVKAVVDYKLPIQHLQKAIREGGPNKIVNEIEKFATQAVVRQVRSFNYISTAMLTGAKSEVVQTSFSKISKKDAQNDLRANLGNLEDSGIAITKVSLVDQIEPTDPKVKRALFKILSKKAEIREAIRDEFQQELLEQSRKRVQQQIDAKRARVNDNVSASQLGAQSMYASASQQTSLSSSQLQPPQQYQPYQPPSRGNGN